MLWQGQAAEVQLYGGVQPRLWPVAGTDGLWEVEQQLPVVLGWLLRV